MRDLAADLVIVEEAHGCIVLPSIPIVEHEGWEKAVGAFVLHQCECILLNRKDRDRGLVAGVVCDSGLLLWCGWQIQRLEDLVGLVDLVHPQAGIGTVELYDEANF